MNHLRPRVPLHCVVEIDYAEVELRVAAALAKKHAIQAELTERAFDAWFKVEPAEKPTPTKKIPLQTTPCQDCGEAGHAEGRCGNASCTKPEEARPIRVGDHVRRITDSKHNKVKVGCVRKVVAIRSSGWLVLGDPIEGHGRKGSVNLADRGVHWERVEWAHNANRWETA